MTRQEHNRSYGVDRQPQEEVHCHTLGYNEFSQYDPLCTCCWLGHSHTWEKHDRNLLAGRRRAEETLANPHLHFSEHDRARSSLFCSRTRSR